MSKKIQTGEKARKYIESGINIVANAVSITLGPKGRNVILDKAYGSPLITNDGVTIAKEIELKNKFENMGAQLVKEVASKTNDVAGDGTTTATVLAKAMVSEGIKNVAAGANGILLRKGIDMATEAVLDSLTSKAKAVSSHENIQRVAAISANDEEVGELIANAMDAVTSAGVITIDDSKYSTCNLKVVEGLQFDKGYLSPYMVTDGEKMEAVLDNAAVLIYDGKMNDVKTVVKVLEQVVPLKKPLLIIAEDVESEVLAMLVVNKLRGVVNVVAVKAPGFGDRRKAMLKDIAVLTNGTVITEEVGIKLENVTSAMFGSAGKIRITKDDTTIIEGAGSADAIEDRKKQILAEIENSTSEYDKEKLNERYAKLCGGVAIIQVGAATETEQKELKLRIEDAINATKAAVAEGIVPGGGAALVHEIPTVDKLITNSASMSPDIITGMAIVRTALYSPLFCIASNAGFKGDVIVSQVMGAEDNVGFDVMTAELKDMEKAGIVDPVKVTKAALHNAASIAAMVLTTDVIITDEKEGEDNTPSGCSSCSSGCMDM